MADAYLGEIRIFGGNYAPNGWAFCNGAILPISQYSTLFAVIGAQYGGDGTTTFALPNLQGSAAMGQGTGQSLTPRVVGEAVGSDTVTLDTTQIPNHNHVPQAISYPASSTDPANNYWAVAPAEGHAPTITHPPLYTATVNAPMSPVALTTAGSSQPHNNMQPYLAMNFIICVTDGEFPSRQ